MPDHLALAAAVLARGIKPPRVVATLADVYRVRAEGLTYVLSPQLARFFKDLEKKHEKEPSK